MGISNLGLTPTTRLCSSRILNMRFWICSIVLRGLPEMKLSSFKS
ncbi:hypothetical protein FDUTEX481_09942 [Tolypothrix sp. PCC 7601]|nr:hypothetical protein FDUTEX481_09942 [Tolypothrix sp. PCC 7601]